MCNGTPISLTFSSCNCLRETEMPISAKPYLCEVSIAGDAEIDFDSYPFNIPAVRDMGVVELHPDVTFFVGENGAGKSTMLEAIAVAMGLPGEGGSRNVHRAQQDCQFIIATHSPILLSYPNAKILQFDGSGIADVAYEDTEHFAVTRDFLNHYPRRLKQLLADD